MELLLNKLFVFVYTSDCESFRSIYIEPIEGVERKTDYDNKIVFLEDNQELFTQGKIYGINNVEALNLLAQYVGEIPSTSKSTNIINYINEVYSSISNISNEKIDLLFA